MKKETIQKGNSILRGIKDTEAEINNLNFFETIVRVKIEESTDKKVSISTGTLGAGPTIYILGHSVLNLVAKEKEFFEERLETFKEQLKDLED